MTPNYILSIGDIAADLLVGIPALPVAAGDLILANQIGLEPGGSANFLIAATRLGMITKAVGVLGTDGWGDQVADILQAEDVDLTHVMRQGSTTLVMVLVGGEGEHAFVGKFGEGAAVAFTDVHREMVEGATAVFATGYSLNEQRLQSLTLSIMQHATEHGIPCYFDPGPSFTSLPKTVQQDAVKFTQVLLLTDDEIPFVSKEKIRDLLAYGLEVIVVKTGEQGCVVITEHERIELPGFIVKTVDTTAAGDSFDAGFVVARAKGSSLVEAARFANAVGAAKVQKFGGGRHVPTLIEVEQVIGNNRTL